VCQIYLFLLFIDCFLFVVHVLSDLNKNVRKLCEFGSYLCFKAFMIHSCRFLTVYFYKKKKSPDLKKNLQIDRNFNKNLYMYAI
jgi:hypothetical protein